MMPNDEINISQKEIHLRLTKSYILSRLPKTTPTNINKLLDQLTALSLFTRFEGILCLDDRTCMAAFFNEDDNFLKFCCEQLVDPGFVAGELERYLAHKIREQDAYGDAFLALFFSGEAVVQMKQSVATIELLESLLRWLPQNDADTLLSEYTKKVKDVIRVLPQEGAVNAYLSYLVTTFDLPFKHLMAFPSSVRSH